MNVPLHNDGGHAKPVAGGYMVSPRLRDAFLAGRIDAKDFNRLVGGPCLQEPGDMVGVREYGDGLPVKCIRNGNGRDTVVAFNEAGHCRTHVDLVDLLQWVKDNRAELLGAVGLESK